jgi:hypothetical protein
MGKPEQKRALSRPQHRWDDNSNADLKEIGWTGYNWLRIGAADRLL